MELSKKELQSFKPSTGKNIEKTLLSLIMLTASGDEIILIEERQGDLVTEMYFTKDGINGPLMQWSGGLNNNWIYVQFKPGDSLEVDDNEKLVLTIS